MLLDRLGQLRKLPGVLVYLLHALQALGEELRPTTLRDGEAPLTGHELAAEAAELFAA